MPATIDDFRRVLSNQRFKIVHFAVHADLERISLLDEVGDKVVRTYDSPFELIGRHKTIQCVMLKVPLLKIAKRRKAAVPLGEAHGLSLRAGPKDPVRHVSFGRPGPCKRPFRKRPNTRRSK